MRIGVVGDYDAGYAPHPATTEAIRHAAAALDQRRVLDGQPG